MAKRGAKGAGNIRKRTITRNGKQYTYWEGRVTTGRDPTTGKQLQRYFSAKTQKEVLEKMQKVAVAVNAIRAGDDIKTIQSNLGHATAAFTLDRYAHFTERMRQDSAQRMEGFIKEVMKL